MNTNKIFSNYSGSEFLVILGNGFDLSHGLKTSYSDFLKHLVELQLNDYTLPSKERKIAPPLFSKKDNRRPLSYSELIKYMQNKNPNNWPVSFHNHFLQKLLSDISTKNWCDIELVYFNELEKILDISTKNNIFKTAKKLNLAFEEIKKHLEQYLTIVTSNSHLKPITSYSHFFSLLSHTDYKILNFNYTNTLDLYSESINHKSNINHIHGEINCQENSIIFGFAADDLKSRNLSNTNDNEYMRNIKKHCYKKTDKENDLNYFLDKSNNLYVIIFGHSCGISDRLILNQIFNNDKLENIWYCYYEKYESYFNGQINIDRIMNNDNQFKKLINYKYSHRIPQHNDDPNMIDNFINFIS